MVFEIQIQNTSNHFDVFQVKLHVQILSPHTSYFMVLSGTLVSKLISIMSYSTYHKFVTQSLHQISNKFQHLVSQTT